MKRITTRLGLILASLLFFNACSKSDESSQSASDSAKDSIPMVAEANRSVNFEPVASRLDLGGVSYVYMDFGDALKGAGSKISQFLGSMQQFDPDPSLMMVSMMPIDQIVDSLGISNLAAYGASTCQEGDLYRNKSVVYLPDGVKGVFTLAGKEAHEFTTLKIAPEDTDVFAEISLHGSAIEDMINTIAKQIFEEQAEEMVEQTLAGEAAPGVTWKQILDQSNTTASVIIRFGEPQAIEVPEVGSVDVPAVEFLISLQNMAWLVNDKIIPVDMMVASQEGDMTLYRSAHDVLADAPYAADWDPALAVKGQDLYMVSKSAYLQECLAGKTSLRNSDAFKQATAGFPEQGNALSFVSKDAFNYWVDLRDKAMEAEPMISSVFAMYELFMPILAIDKQNAGSASIMVVDATSIFSDNRWPAPSGGMSSMNGTVTVGLLAAMAIPAFQKVRVQSKEKAITNNLRQIASAGQQYILEEGVTEVSYNKLVGDYFAEIQSVDGEDYTQIVISEEGGVIEVTTDSGESITYSY